MGWQGFPLNSDDIQAWEFIRQFWDALRERGFAASQSPYFARTSAIWSSGTITAITASSLTDSSRSGVDNPNGWYNNQWSEPTVDGIPTRYSVCLDDPDPRKVQKIPIASNTQATLHFAAQDWIDPQVYVGKRYYIVTRYSPWWHERYIAGPNDRPLLLGTATGGSYSTLVDASRNWQTNQWNGKHLVVEGRGRALISGNNATTLTFGVRSSSVSAGDRYAIVEPSAVYEFGRVPDPPYRWYSSLAKSYWTHDPSTDSIGTTSLPLDSMLVPDCSQPSFVRTQEMFDVDYWDEISKVEGCPEIPDKCYTPDLYKTFRGLQLACEQLCYSFIEPVDWTGRNALSNFTVATYFRSLGLNTITVTISGYNENTNTASFADISGNALWVEDNPSVYFTVLDGYRVLQEGYTTPGHTTLSGLTGDASWVGKTIVFAFGWTRKLPREFRYMYPKTVFIPDVDPDGNPVYPPTVEYPGQWVTRGPSTHYKTTTPLGFVADSTDSHDTFQVGDLARYSGDNWNDPTIYPWDEVRDAGQPGRDGEGADLLDPYYDRFYVGKRSPSYQFGDSGTSTGGTNHSLTDTNKSWPNALEHDRWKGRTLRITKDDNTTVDVLITASNANTLSFASQAFTVLAGWSYTIIEAATGTVWCWDGSKWVVPDPQTYGGNQYAIRPKVVTRYGRMMKGDYISLELFNELHDAINKLKHIQMPASWTAFARPWIDTPLYSSYAMDGASGGLYGNANDPMMMPPPAEWVGKDIQIRDYSTGAMIRCTITGVDYAIIYFDSDYAPTWGSEFWILETDANDVVPNFRYEFGNSHHAACADSWGAAYSGNCDAWNDPYPEERAFLSPGAAPRCYTEGRDIHNWQEPGYTYCAEFYSVHSYGQATPPYQNYDASLFTMSCDFYALGAAPSWGSPPRHVSQWLTNNEPTLQQDKWVKFDTRTSHDDGKPVVSRKVGDVTTIPAAGQAPPLDQDNDGETWWYTDNGFVITDQAVIMKYETSGLLTYL